MSQAAGTTQPRYFSALQLQKASCTFNCSNPHLKTPSPSVSSPCPRRSAELTTVLSKDLDAVRTFVFGNTSRDRGLRAVLEASGSVLVLFWLSWRLGPILAGTSRTWDHACMRIVTVCSTCLFSLSGWLYRCRSL